MVRQVMRLIRELGITDHFVTGVKESPYASREPGVLARNTGFSVKYAPTKGGSMAELSKDSFAPLVRSMFAARSPPKLYAYVAAVPFGAEEKAEKIIPEIRRALKNVKSKGYAPNVVHLVEKSELDAIPLDNHGNIGASANKFIVYYLKKGLHENLLKEAKNNGIELEAIV